MKKIYLKIAGILNLITAFAHLAGGQLDLVNPLQNSSLEVQEKAEWIGVWHMVTILLFFTSFLILKAGFGKNEEANPKLLKPLGYFYMLAGIPFLFSGIYFSVLAPQWILLIPIGILLIIGAGKLKTTGE